MFVAGQRDDLVALLQDAAGQRQDLGAALGQRYAPRLSLDQLHAQVVFQLLQLRRQRRLTDEGAFGGLAEVLGVGQGHEIPQVAQVHGRSIL